MLKNVLCIKQGFKKMIGRKLFNPRGCKYSKTTIRWPIFNFGTFKNLKYFYYL